MAEQSIRTELYLVRHAESAMNLQQDVICGRSNRTFLSPNGLLQSERLGQFLVDQDIKPARLYSSPAARCILTGILSASEANYAEEIVIDDDLQELSQDAYEGRRKADVYTPEVMSELERLGKDFALPGAESMNDVAHRIAGWADRLLEEPAVASGTEQVLAYTHEGAIKYWASAIEGWTHADTYDTHIDNASLNLFVHDGASWQVAYVSRTA